MENTTQIQFLKKFNMYAVGDIAGFPPTMAEKLVTNGIARFFSLPDLANRTHVQRKIITKSK